MDTALQAIVPSRVRRQLLVELYGRGRRASIRGFSAAIAAEYSATYRELISLAGAGLATERPGPRRARIFGPVLAGERIRPILDLVVDDRREREIRREQRRWDLTPRLRQLDDLHRLAAGLRASLGR